MDWKQILILLTACFVLVATFNFTNRTIIIKYDPLDNMPIISGPINHGSGSPVEDRGTEYRKYLSSSVKIRNGDTIGSGTIVYYDYDKNEAWVASCGHLWDGNMKATSRNKKKAEIVTWYHNNIKLVAPRTYVADVIFYNNSAGFDLSLLKFTPDWHPDYFSIAPYDYVINVGDLHHSTGCDRGSEVARYEVEIIQVGNTPGVDTRIKRNSPRPGRSGGGLLTSDGYFIGICWGTTDPEGGSGEGIFTSLPSIHQFFEKEGYGWILKVPTGLARRLTIVDRENPYRDFPKNYVPMPLIVGITSRPCMFETCGSLLIV